MRPVVTTRAAGTGIYAALLLVLVAVATPTRVGDGGEYIAMADNLSRLKPPALSLNDIARVGRRLDTLGPSYGMLTLQFRDLRGRDGRQDFPHFWIYPLLAAPPLAMANAASVHPNHAFSLVNVALLACAWWLVVPRLGTWLTALVLVSPIVWWVDKAHADAFTYATLTVAFALVTTRPVYALVAMGLACAQYPPITVTLPVVLVVAWHVHGGLSWSAVTSPTARALRRATLAALALAATPMLYYLARLGVLTPLAGWTSAHVPTAAEMAAFVTDPNIGLAWAFPGMAVAIVTALAAVMRRTPRALASLVLLAGPVCALLLLAGVAQSLNINHGATRGVNRQSLWLVPLALPLLLAWRDGAASRDGRATRVIASASVLLSLWAFAPLTPEKYLTASRPAAWLWRTMPGFDNPPLEVFSERVSHTEPGIAPIASPGCRKVLVSGGRFPVPCPPWPVAPECRADDRLCYANASGSGYRFVQVPPRGAQNLVVNPRTWPIDPAAQARVRDALAQIATCRPAIAPAGESGSVIRATSNVEWTLALQCASEFLIYVAAPGEGASLTLRLPRPMALTRDDLTSHERDELVVHVDQAWDPVGIDVPASPAGVLLHLK